MIQKRWIQLSIFLALAICFLILQLYENVSFNKQHVLTVYSIKKHSAIAFIENRNCYLLTDTVFRNDNASIQFHLQQYLWKRGVVEPVFISKKYRKGSFFKNGPFILFDNKKIVLIDSSYAYRIKKMVIGHPVKIDVVVLMYNANIRLDQLLNHFSCGKIIVDESNNYFRIRQWKKEAERYNVEVYFTNEEGAYVAEI